MIMQDISIKVPRIVHKEVRKKAIDWDCTIESAYGRLLMSVTINQKEAENECQNQHA